MNASPDQIAHESNKAAAHWSIEDLEVVLNKETGKLTGGWIEFCEDAGDFVSDNSMNHAEIVRQLRSQGIHFLLLDNMIFDI